MLKAGNEKREREKKDAKPAISKSVTENGRAPRRFSALLQSHTENPPRPRRRNTLALL